MAGGSKKAIVAALVANLGIAAAKFLGFFFTGASSMLAEAVHSCADSGNQALLLFGAHRGSQSATATHPFGFGRERYFWAFVVALVLFALGSVFAIVEGIEKLLHPHELESPLIAVVILLAGVALEGWSFRTALKEASALRGDQPWLKFIRSTKQAELPVIILEDFGALIGLAIALFGVGLSLLTGDARFDALATVAIGVLLGVIAVVLAIEMKSLLVGEGASVAHHNAITRAITDGSAVRRLIHLRTLHLGPEELLVATKVEYDAELTFSELTRAINATEAAIRNAVPIAALIYVEPDQYDPARARAVVEQR